MNLPLSSFEARQKLCSIWDKDAKLTYSRSIAPLKDSVYAGWLEIPNKPGRLKRRYFVLTHYKLYFCKSSKDIRVIKESNIE